LQLLAHAQGSGLLPDTIMYSAAISACEHAQEWETALSLFADLQARSLLPSLVTYNASVSACEKAWRWELSLHLLERARHGGLGPNVVTYTAAISACSAGSRWRACAALVEDMHLACVMPNAITAAVLRDAYEQSSCKRLQLFPPLTEECSNRVLPPDLSSALARQELTRLGACWQQACNTAARRQQHWTNLMLSGPKQSTTAHTDGLRSCVPWL